MRFEGGSSFVEVLAAVALVGLGLATALPSLDQLRAASRAAAGAGYMAVTLHGLRWQSVAQSQGHGLLFRREGSSWSWIVARDGNGNGLRATEVSSGVDLTLSGPQRLEDKVGGVHLGFPARGPIRRIPPEAGWIESLDDPVRVGASDLLAFGPLGTSTSGTIYVSDGREQLYGIVVFGRTGRIRVWRFDATTGRWRL
jgi:hypothetical protein